MSNPTSLIPPLFKSRYVWDVHEAALPSWSSRMSHLQTKGT
jgi:hypothetical protein